MPDLPTPDHRPRGGVERADPFVTLRILVLCGVALLCALAACGSNGAANGLSGHGTTTTRPAGADTAASSAAGTGATTTTTAPVGSSPWTASSLTITARSLGAVHIGMTRGQAEQAAGVTFDGFGDGFAYPTTLPPGFPHDFVGGVGISPDGVVQCVGASGAPTAQSVSTPLGLHLGDPASRVLAVYGAQARYVPAPTSGGMTAYAGYVVSTADGNLAFVISGNTVTEIEGGNGTLGPNSCTG